MITISKATQHGIRALSRKLLKLLEDKNGQIYQDNVAKFVIPEEYVKKVFSEETLLASIASRKSAFYLALENKCKILGFAQTVQRDPETVELDRIVVFPEFTGRGIGTQLLARVIKDQKCKKTKTMIVNVGKGETHARLFYEKNGCELTKEYMMNAPWCGKIALVTYQLRLKT